MKNLLVLLALSGFVLMVSSCSSSDSRGETNATAAAAAQANPKKGSSLVDKYGYKQEDVQRGGDGVVVGGKRSQFDTKRASAYAAANSDSPSYLQKKYNQKRWSGEKSYSAGSYKTASYSKSGQRSRWAGRSSREGSQVSRSDGQRFRTGGYQTNSANESGRRIRSSQNAYAQNRAADGWGGRSNIIDYRDLSVDQAKTLLGR